MKFVLFLVFVFNSYLSESQSIIFKPQELDSVIYSKMNSKIKGFRIQLECSNDFVFVDNARIRFMNEYPDIPFVVENMLPFYKLKIGNYITRVEASQMLELLRFSYTSPQIIEEEIDLPSIN